MPNRNLSSLFVSYKGKSILFDCGEGTQIAMRKYGTGFKDLGLILISHLHGDHVFGLPGLLSSMGSCGKTDPLTIVGPAGITKMVDAILPMLGHMPYPISVIENPPSSFVLERHEVFKEIDFHTMHLDHSMPCLGYSLTFTRLPEFSVEKATENNVPIQVWKTLQKQLVAEYNGVYYTQDMVLGKKRKGIKLSFIADTRYFAGIDDFVKDSDLLVCEAMYGGLADIEKTEKNKHMLFEESAKIAANGHVKRLVLTHFSPSMEKPEEYIENARNVFENVELGFDGMKMGLRYED